MRILGIDPGLQTTGFGVIDVDGQRLWRHLRSAFAGSGILFPPAAQPA